MKHLLFGLCALCLLTTTAWAAPTGGNPTPARPPQTVQPESAPTPQTASDSTHQQSPLQFFVQGIIDWMYGDDQPTATTSDNERDNAHPLSPKAMK